MIKDISKGKRELYHKLQCEELHIGELSMLCASPHPGALYPEMEEPDGNI